MIKIENIYYMLSYAYQVLKLDSYKDLLSENFDHANDLLAAILAKGIASQIRRGLGREYLSKTEALASPIGKMSVTSSIRFFASRNRRVVCEFDEFTHNNTLNRILKTTLNILLSDPHVRETRRKKLKSLLPYFSEIETTLLSKIDWKNIPYNRNNSTYKMLINICYLVVQGLILSTIEGNKRYYSFVDEIIKHKLFEKFILEYYKYHYHEVHVSPEFINWESDDGIISLLPTMKTDVTIRTKSDYILIIDAKFYNETLQKNPFFDNERLRSQNLYQIYSYVKNMDRLNTGKVSGILLYVKTENGVDLNNEYILGGNRFGVHTLDLSSNFHTIKIQLDNIISKWHNLSTGKDLVRSK